MEKVPREVVQNISLSNIKNSQRKYNIIWSARARQTEGYITFVLESPETDIPRTFVGVTINR